VEAGPRLPGKSGREPEQIERGDGLRRTLLLLMSGLFLLSTATCNAQILHKRKKKAPAPADENVQPDKILYDRALNDIKHGRYDSGRLNLQTLINTYPDSEYLAKAKLSIADAYFKEGGTANMTQAIAGYKDFIVFFPFLPEAAYAQKQVAMAHYSQMQKPDRDRTEAKLAEDEFQTFLQKYPNDALAANAEQRLREVQEVLAEGEYRVGYYYYVKGDAKAAAGRLISVTRRYPLYSRSDHALWMLGDLFEKSEHKDIAAVYYGQILRNYPKSSMVGNAKDKLVAFNVPVPQPDPQAMARMTADQNAPRPHANIVKRPVMALLKNGPGSELRSASRVGTPNMQPESESSGTDILAGGGAPRLGGGGTGIVATVTPGTTGGAESSGTASDGNSGNTPAGTDGNAPAPASNDAPAAAATSTADPASATSSASANTSPDTSGAAAKTDGASNSSSTDSANSGNTDNSQKGASSTNGKESSSKKKKGLRKVIPW